MPDYAPHGNYEIALDPRYDHVIRVAASGSVNIEMLRIHNDRTNEIVEGFRGRPYGMVCDFNGGMIMTPDAEDAWIRSAASRVARGWSAVAYHFDDTADYRSMVRAQVTRVFDSIGVPWFEAADETSALAWVLEQLGQSTGT
ncbi:hypothetical protein NUH88_12565 [Nisaea acidiphila]|uniref:Uncharacterized protein n=1 Tax=Nisaea acidiphila TaxID=1862145 RepID=A0A9J7AL93_9PROT|nr:hypothetical protein [Nisaea acidiphila]UUX48248.1 hypothetical protein NUH88_12565 [Nisaea acidiphila]